MRIFELFRRAIAFVSLVAAVMCAAPATVHAQTIILLPGSALSFTASPDHNATFAGAPIVSVYKTTYCLKATPTVCPITVDLGKPSPDATNTITVTSIFGSLVSNTEYVATVIATGPGGDSPASNPTAPFGKPGAPGGPANAAIKR